MLAPGRCLGPYRIREPVGSGGMGEVYEAVDTRLGRTVAVKVLKTSVAGDSDFRQRFEREARTISNLNHAHICTLFDVGQQDGIDFLVMEYVEGETLAQRLQRGALPPEEALRYALEIAAALDAAHEKGIVHRDLKPANIKITSKGVKLLDFGIAKILAEVEPGKTEFDSSTASNMTRVGSIIGTAGYMSPEQARGKPVDRRADIWAFGCIVYESLTGKPAFTGETDSDMLAAVLEREPNWRVLPLVARGAVRDVLQHCLRKDPARRLRDIGDASEKLEHALGRARQRSRVIVAAAAGFIGLATIVGAALWWEGAIAPTTVPASDWIQLTNFIDSVSQPALSPNGNLITFVRGPGTFQTEGQIYVKVLPDGEPKQLTNDGLRKMSPVFSPDGSQIAYTTISSEFQWDTWVVPVLGGEPREWLPNASGLVWLDSEQLLFSEIKSGIHMAIVTAEQNRAGARDVFVPEHERGMGHRSYPSPDRSSAVVVEMDGAGAWARCRLVPLDASSPGRQVGPATGGCTFAGWSPDGRYIYLSSSAGGAYHIWRQRLPAGQPEQITSGPLEEEGIAVAPDGQSLVTAVGSRQRWITLHDGRGDRQISIEGYAFNPKFTRDGTRLFYQMFRSPSALDGPSELWVADTDSGRSERFYSGIASAGTSGSSAGGGSYDVSADGRRVVLTAQDDDGKFRIWLVPVDRSASPRQIPGVEGHQPMFGPPGEILFRASDERQRFLYRVREDGQELRKAVPDAGDPLGVSLDGRWLARWADAGGAALYPLDGGAPIAIYGRDARMRWSADGRSLFLSVSSTAGTLYSAGRTYVIPLDEGRLLPTIPAEGFRSEAEIAALAGVQVIDAADMAPGPRSNLYAFSREATQRNLFRIPLPRR
jgi:eukaryotic-like serine/threonine-protein kinase